MIGLVNSDSLHIPLRDKSVHMIATSPPYWGLRDYGLGKWSGGREDCDHIEVRILSGLDKLTGANPNGRECQKCGATRSNPGLGLEPVHDCLGWARGENCGACYVCRMRLFASECFRVLRDDGTLWLNLGDSYNAGRNGGYAGGNNGISRPEIAPGRSGGNAPGLKPKDLVGIPWRVALALQADGWYLRSDIVWAKSNPMPESVKDRPTKAHEYIFLLAKRERYFYDQEAVREENADPGRVSYLSGPGTNHNHYVNEKRESVHVYLNGYEPGSGRNRRTVWNIATAPYPGAHFACWPPDLVEPMIKAGTSERGCCPECGAQWERVTKKGTAEMRPDNPNPVIPYTANGSTQHGTGTTTLHMTRSRQTVEWRPSCEHNAAPIPCIVLDTFTGSGTTGQVARQLGRHFIGLDLSFDYLSEQAKSRLELDRLEAWGNGIEAGHDNLEALPLFGAVG